MHSLVEVPVGGNNAGTHVPAFLAKLWKIVDDVSTNDLICWSEMGNSFIIRNQAKFARDLLPLYYKHNNMASFVRQLNMYGFHKVVSVEQGGLRVEKDEMEFAHPFFLKGQEASLELIKRKIPASKHEESRVRPDSLNKVLIDVRQMKGRQESMDNKLVTMKRENEALWRELASLRQKHAKQTQIVSKLLQFLVGMMSQQTPRLAFKRRMPLMLNDKDGVKQKFSRTDASESSGPVIHDVTELEFDDSGDDNDPDIFATGLAAADKFSVQSPLSNASKSPYPADGSIGGTSNPASPEVLFAVDPVTVAPSVPGPATVSQLQQSTQSAFGNNKILKPKPKLAAKKSPPTSTITSVKPESTPTTAVPFNNIQTISASQPQFLQVPGISVAPQTQTNLGVPTTLYFTTPGSNEPVQVVLSIPDANNVAAMTSQAGTVNNSVPFILPGTSSVASKPMPSVQPQQPQPQQQSHPLTNVPMNKSQINGDPIGRSQTANPKYFLKSNGLNGSVAPQDLDVHLDDVEVGLNNLRDLFKGQDYQMDSDTLIGLFDGSASGADNTENMTSNNGNQGITQGADAQRSEMVAYNPSLFELAEDDTTFFDETSNMFLDDELESMLTTDRDTLKRSDGHSRAGGHSLSFSGINLSNSLIDSGVNTPVVETAPSPLNTPQQVGVGKRKMKREVN